VWTGLWSGHLIRPATVGNSGLWRDQPAWTIDVRLLPGSAQYFHDAIVANAKH
jgi:hypothetical protein